MKRRFSFAQKVQILKEATLSGCSVSDVAKAHNISRCTIYAWLRANRASKSSELAIANKINNNFVEIALIDSQIATSKSFSLQKASFAFDDLAFSFEGNLNSKNLQKIINILETIC